MKKITVVHKNKTENIDIDKLKKSVVGQKTLGLVTIPPLWTPDFFVVSSEFFSEYKETKETIDKKELINEYSKQIIEQCRISMIGEEIILRSSASKESMEERGKYDSQVSNLSDLNNNLENLLESLLVSCSENIDIAIVVQKYINSNQLGHMSNERRFHHDARDWKIELYSGSSFSDSQICIRKWRTTYNLNELSNNELKYSSSTLLKELRKVAYFWCINNNNFRYHIEFVYTDDRIYLVQADCAIGNVGAKNPTDYNITINCDMLSNGLKLLRTYDYSESNYKKLQNLKKYRDIGLPTTTLYYLDDTKTLNEISKGVMSSDLESDIKLLLSIQSIVIRSDIISCSKYEMQMLPRSNELKDYDTVKRWLFGNVKNIINKQGIFIFHNFIPSISSAFAHAKPNGTKVEMQSLWGLPEGLYYNAHDTAIVKFPYSDLTRVSENNSHVNIKKNYKDSFVYPEDSGKWSVERVAEPFDWKYSIQDPHSVFDIAIQSQKIANAYGEEISVMWFVGIDENYYGSKNLPWFHEKIELEADSYTNDSYKRKYFKDEEFVLKDQKDIEKLKATNENIKCVRIKPKDESILRNKNFLYEIGKIAIEKNLSILLEGAQLTHAYYQLKRTGANVVCAKSNEFEISNDMEFNKLVRDRIPEIIVAGGESVKCGKACDTLYDRLLLEKLLEEAYEVKDSSKIIELKEEIADMLEVLDSINAKIQTDYFSKLDFNERLIKTSKNSIFNKKKSFEKKQSFEFEFDEKYCLLKIERQKTEYRIELSISKLKKANTACEATEWTEISKLKTKVVRFVSQLLNTKSSSKTKKILENIDATIKELCHAASIDFDEIQKIKLIKNKKRGGFSKGYILLNTSLAESYAECDVFNPDNCAMQTTITRPLNKYVDLRRDEENNNEILLIRFNAPLAINNWGISFESKKIKEFFYINYKLDFKFTKSNTGELRIVLSLENEMTQQLSFFDL